MFALVKKTAKFTVNGQDIAFDKKNSDANFVSNTLGIYYAEFTFSEEWENFDMIYAVFKNTKSEEKKLLTLKSGTTYECEINTAFISTDKLTIGCIGYLSTDTDVRYVTDGDNALQFTKSINIVDGEVQPSELSILEQLTLRVNSLEESISNGTNSTNIIESISINGTALVPDENKNVDITIPEVVKGEDGVGVPTGGTTGQILAKKSDTDYDTEWVDKPTAESVDMSGIDLSLVNGVLKIKNTDEVIGTGITLPLLSSISPTDKFYLKSTNGTIYSITVSDAGILTATSVEDTNGLEDLQENRLLAWHDEFDGDSLNENNWIYETGKIRNTSIELQTYTTDNARVENSCLVFTADDNSDGVLCSSDICSQGKFIFTYGRIEAKIKFPPLSFGAFWTTGQSLYTEYEPTKVNYGEGWSKCGEFDIVEIMNEVPSCGIYYGGNNSRGTSEGRKNSNGITPTEWHIYAMEWYEDGSLEFYIDGTKVSSVVANDDTAFHNPHKIILNLAVTNSSFEKGGEMFTDWVRYYLPSTCTEKVDSPTGLEIVSDDNVTSIEVGSCLQLRAKYTPTNCVNKIVTWSSSDSSIATVMPNGWVTAISPGNVTITAESDNGVSSTYELSIVYVSDSNITGTLEDMGYNVNTNKNITITYNDGVIKGTATTSDAMYSATFENPTSIEAKVKVDSRVSSHLRGVVIKIKSANEETGAYMVIDSSGAYYCEDTTMKLLKSGNFSSDWCDAKVEFDGTTAKYYVNGEFIKETTTLCTQYMTSSAVQLNPCSYSSYLSKLVVTY